MSEDTVTRKERFDRYRARGSLGFRTKSLFADVIKWEDKEGAAKAPYWLWKNETGDDRPCLRDWFLHFENPEGYEAAMKFFGNTEHWTKMYESSTWFREAVDAWNKELRLKLSAKALKATMDVLNDENAPAAQRVSAAKFITAEMKDAPEVRKRGRPSKEEVSGNIKEAERARQSTEEDWERITKDLN